MTDEDKPKLSRADEVFVSEYLLCFNATAAYKKAHPNAKDTTAASNGWKLLRKTEIKEAIQSRLDEVHMGADEALKIQAEFARADVGVFFKVTDEWMFNPLPEYEILDEREVLDETVEPPKVRISYRVRHVVLDMDKIIDPRYSHLIHKFSNSRKNGLSIETYDRQAAIRDILKIHGKFTDKVDVTSNGETIAPKEDNARFDRAIESLADALREAIPHAGNGAKGKVDTSE